MQIIILTEVPLSQRDYDRFGIDVLLSNFNVLVFDCTPWLNPVFWEKYSQIRYEFPGYKIINDWDEFNSGVLGLSNVVAIDYLGDCSTSQSIRHKLRNWNIRRVLVRCGLLPQLKGVGRLKRASRQGSLIGRVLNKLSREVRAIVHPKLPPPELVVLSAEAGLRDKRVQGVRHYIWAHSFDYDVFLKCRDKIRDGSDPYVVFLDSDLVFHPEYILTGEKPVVTVEKYYPSMNRFFDRFEQVTGLRVVIAAHPRSRYDLRPQLYAKRIPVLGQTPELVRDATLVMVMQSTATSYAILWNKPLVYLNTVEYEKSDHSVFMYEHASQLHAKIINIDSFVDADINLELLIDIDEAAYADYKRMFIKRPGTPERPIWEIFSDYVRKNLC